MNPLLSISALSTVKPFVSAISSAVGAVAVPSIASICPLRLSRVRAFAINVTLKFPEESIGVDPKYILLFLIK